MVTRKTQLWLLSLSIIITSCALYHSIVKIIFVAWLSAQTNANIPSLENQAYGWIAISGVLFLLNIWLACKIIQTVRMKKE